MGANHDRDATSQVNPKQPISRQVPASSLVELIVMAGGGWLPDNGEYSPSVWAAMWGLSEDTVNRYINDLDVPIRRHGDLTTVHRDDWVNAIPKRRPSEIRAEKEAAAAARKKR